MEIPKYRAWVTGTEIMYQPREAWINNGEVWLSNSKGLPEKKVADDQVILSRATGYKDQNGVQIFEGDIVRFFDSLYTVFYDIEEGSYRLKPHDDRWVVDYMSNFSSEESFEIIGNIYENKEQLW